MSNLHERHPPMGSEKDIECQVTSLTSVNEKDMISFSSSEEEDDELALRVKTLLAENQDEQISFEQRKTVQKNSEFEDLYSGSNVTIKEDPQLKRVDSSAVPDNSFNQLEFSTTSTSYYSIADIREKQTVDYDFKHRCCGTNTSHMNLGNDHKVLIQSDLSLRPKISLRNIERNKNSKTNKDLKDSESEMSLKRVSFSSSQTYEGNMNILGFMKSSGGATPLKSFEYPKYQPISDLPEECRKHILSAPTYIDSEVLDGNEYSRFTTDNPISSSEVLPHIRWYPYPSYKSSQDFKNVSTQTSLKHSKEVGPSSNVLIELHKSFDDSTNATQHLYMSETVDLSTVNLCSMLPDWQAGADINLTSYRSHIDHPNLSHMKAHEDGSSKEIFPSEKLRENVEENSDEAVISDASQLFQESSSHYRIKQQENNDFHDTEPGTATIEQEFIINFSQEDASTQTSDCECLNELKNKHKEALNIIINDHVCPCHQRIQNQEEVKKNSEHKKQTEKVSPSEEYVCIIKHFLEDSGSDVTINEDPQLKRVDSSPAPDNSLNQLEFSTTSRSYYSIADIREKQTVDYDFKDRCCGTNTSHMNLGKEHKVLIQSDLSVRPKISLRKPERKKNSKTNKKDLKDSESEMSLKRVSFSSSQTYEGNMNILGFLKSSGGATPLKCFEYPMYLPISDLPEECRKHILSAPTYRDSEVLDGNEYSRFTTDNPISSSEVLPHIRWYPYPSYKSSQDFKNASTQTSLKHSKEVGPSSKILIELHKSFDDSTDATQHLHMSETVDLSTVNLCSMLPDWQAGADINLTSYRSHIDHPNLSHMKAHEDGSSEEIFPSEKLRESVKENSDKAVISDASQLFQENSSDYRIKQQENNDFHDTEPGAAAIKQEFITNFSQEDASTQTSDCDCLNEVKNNLKKALDLIIKDLGCPSHQRIQNQEEIKKILEHKKQTEKVSPSIKYAILFMSEDPQTAVITKDAPLLFHSFLASTRKEKSEGRLSKGKIRLMDENEKKKEEQKKDEQKKILLKLHQRYAQNFARKLKNEALKGKVNYARNERILGHSSIY